MKAIRLSKSTVTEADKKAVLRVLDSEYLGMGAEVQAFENELQSCLQTDRAVVCVNTGTAALHLALQACDIGPGDEVLVPSLTYVASFQAISATGATPVACDVRADSLFLDIEDAARRLTPQTRAIMPVHYASDSRGLDPVYDFSRRRGLRVIEDAAHSFGSQRGGEYIGRTGDIICFSFDGIKNITAGEGGAVITSDPEILRRVRDARLLGVEKDTEKRYAQQRSWEFDVKEQGWRYHMSNIMAALGREQLKRLDSTRAKRQAIAGNYMELLGGIKQLDFLCLDFPNIIPHIFVIRVKDGQRDGLREFLTTHKIESGVHYFPNHRLTRYRTAYPLPVTEKAYDEILSLPCHLDLTVEQQEYVTGRIAEYFNHG